MKNLLFFLFFSGFSFLLSAAELNIVCTTDLHGHFERIPALSSVIRSAGEEALKIDVGDTLTGTPYSDSRGGKPMMTLLNKLKYDVWVPGNHDFEAGYNAFSMRVREFKGSVLGAQWSWRDIRPLPWKLFVRSGVRAAVIGLTDPAMFSRVLPGDGGVFRNEIEALKAVMPQIHAARPHVIILACHNGEYSRYGSTFTLSRTFPEIDLILGGHSHQDVPGKRLANAWFVQAGCYGKKAAVIKVTVDDKSGRIRKITSGLYDTVPGKRERKLERLCLDMEKEQRRLESAPLVPGGKRIVLPRMLIGKHLAEMFVKKTPGTAALVQRPELKFIRKKNRRFKNTLAGVGTYLELYRLFPFNNRICLVKVSRNDLKELEDFCRINASRRKVRYFFAGDISSSGNGRLEMKKDTVSLAVSDYLLVSVPVLKKKLNDPACWQLLPGLTEREIALEMFRSLIRDGAAGPSTPPPPERR